MADPDLPAFHGIIGRSPAMRVLFGRIARVAPIDVPVLIRGESGTGKELVAAAIHRLSSRRDRRLQIVNCGALSPELLMSELFGHERGAFTGASDRKKGLLVMADGGTLFLDEVGELIPQAQVMLLRFLQQGEVRPVGSTETGRVDVRLIAATHRDLTAQVRRGRFREDLYYRLRRVMLEVPPLRERVDDIPILAEHFRRTINLRYRLGVERLSPRALACLEHHAWPGNVRELETVLEQAMIFHAGGWIRPEELALPGAEAHATGPSRQDPEAEGVESGSWTWPQQEALRIATTLGEVQRADLMARCGVSGDAARRVLTGLMERGLLTRIGAGRSARYLPRGEPADRVTPPGGERDSTHHVLGSEAVSAAQPGPQASASG